MSPQVKGLAEAARWHLTRCWICARPVLPRTFSTPGWTWKPRTWRTVSHDPRRRDLLPCSRLASGTVGESWKSTKGAAVPIATVVSLSLSSSPIPPRYSSRQTPANMSDPVDYKSSGGSPEVEVEADAAVAHVDHAGNLDEKTKISDYKADAIEAENEEHNMTVMQAVRAYPMAAFWAVVMSSTIVSCLSPFPLKPFLQRIAANTIFRLWSPTMSSSPIISSPSLRSRSNLVNHCPAIQANLSL